MFYLLYGFIFLIAAFQLQYYLPQLPDPVATHFDFAGTPNGWMSKKHFAYFYGILLPLLTGIFALLGLIIRKMPDKLINIPHKAYWLAPERREKSMRSLQNMNNCTGVVVGFFVVLIMQAVIVANLERYPQLGFDRVMSLLGVLVAFALFNILYIRRRFRAPGER
jgi:uncharacterized membrane protein